MGGVKLLLFRRVVPLSRPTSPGISDSELDDGELRSIPPEEDRRFYEEMLGDNPPLEHVVPAPLDFGGDSEPGDDPGDNPANGDADSMAAGGPDSEPDENEPAPVLHDDPGDEPEDPYATLGAAFEQPGRLRNIYIRTWVESVFGGSTRQQTTRILASHRLALEDAADEGTLSEALLECLPTMPQTLRSLERRLGVNSDEHLKIYALCQGCGKRYSMHAINHAHLPGCPRVLPETGLPCGYPVWEEKELYGGVKKRIPLKCFPFFPPAPSIERILSRPGIWELLTSRPHGTEDDPPLSKQHWMRATPLDERFGDVSQAWAWNSDPAGLKRQWNDDARVYEDVPVGRHRPVALANLPLGLSLSFFTDAFQAFGYRGYSSCGVFLVINNLPFNLRHLVENIILVAVVPGTGEKPYLFDQIMEPLVDALIELEQGVPMRVYNLELSRCDEALVNSHLSFARLDYMARRVVCGHAGTASEMNFCMYCHMRRSYLSVPKGFKDFQLRDPVTTLDQKHAWLREPNAQRREAMRQRTGVIFTEFDRLGGWYAGSMCPPDVMHTVHLGTTRLLVQEIILGPGLIEPRHNDAPEDQPLERANRFLDNLIFPSFCARKIPEFSRLLKGGKAEQFRHLEVVLYVVLFEAWRLGDSVPEGNFRRGHKKGKAYRLQQQQAKEVFRRRRCIHRYEQGDPDNAPTLESCLSVRSRRVIFANVLTYCRALKKILSRSITRAGVSRAQALFYRVTSVFARLNCSLAPQWHYLQHLGDALLKFGSAYQTWVFPGERLNRLLVNVNKNNHTLGTMETTMARGFLKRAEAYGLASQLQSLPNPTCDDTQTIDLMLKLMRNGPAHELQRGTLNAILAGEARFRGQERIALATTSCQVDWTDGDHFPFWDMVMDYCSAELHGVPVYGYGAPPHGGVRLDPEGSAHCFPYVHHGGLRFGNDFQTRGFSSHYGFIENQVPVLIRRIYQCRLELEDEPEPHKILCAVVQCFTNAPEPAVFPWDTIHEELEVQSWAYGELEDPEVVSINTFMGVFALGDITMSTGHYWLTFTMQPVEPEPFEG